jgi:hypothetical protein
MERYFVVGLNRVKGEELCHGYAFIKSPTNYHYVDEVPQHQELNEEDWSCISLYAKPVPFFIFCRGPHEN